MTTYDIPVQVIVAAFKSQTTANQVLDELKRLQHDGHIRIEAAAVLDKDANGQLHIRDTRDWGFGRGALAGGALGLVIGLIAGPVGWAALGSALVGGVMAKVHHTYNFDEARLRRLGESLQPGNSAIVAVVDHVWVARVEAAMRQESMDLVVESISKDVAEQLASGQEVAYTAVATSDAMAVARAATVEGQPQLGESQAAAPQGEATEAAAATGEGAAAEPGADETKPPTTS